MDFNMKDVTSQFSQEDIDKNKVVGLIGYIWILFLVPLLAAKDSPYAKFHANQGLVLFLCSTGFSICMGIIVAIIPFLYFLNIIGIAFFVLMILGIVYTASGKAVELPVIGKIKLLK